MGNALKYLLLLLWISYLFITGIMLFTRGFLLKRTALPNHSTCEVGSMDFSGSLDYDHSALKFLNSSTACWLPRRYEKAVIIILDGLRYDFATYNESLGASDALFFQNKLPVLHELERGRPDHAALLKFVADPPTTTMQRIKGLITGSLPTFIDAGDNFASVEIGEDNIIDQLVNQGRKLTFMGDDTWMGLLPKRFSKAFAFPSFDVKDLDTVDNGIIENLLPELKRGDWDVLIAHFLGIDHCGHRYGPNHQAMATKLSQMDKMLRATIDSLDPETLLVVMGDHGMTRTGDHGGDSVDEVESVLFVYSKKILRRLTMESTHEVKQIDFAPTFSLLLGIPVPFGNLGTVIPDFFTQFGPHFSENGNDNTDFQGEIYAATALYLNVKQVETYLKRYKAVASDLSEEMNQVVSLQDVAEIDALWRSVSRSSDSHKQLTAITAKSKVYLELVKNVCEKTWAQFNMLAIISGLCITSCALLTVVSYGVFQPQTTKKAASILCLLAVCGSVFVVLDGHPLFRVQRGIETAAAFAFLSVLVFFINSLCNQQCRGVSVQPRGSLFVPAVTSCLAFGCFFSNSYVLCEDSLSSFLASTVLWWEVLSHKPVLNNLEIKQKSKSEQQFHCHRLMSIVLAAIGTLMIRLQRTFWKCREEQWWCEPSDLAFSLSDIPTHSEEYVTYKNWRFFTSVVSLWCIVFVLQWLMRKSGNMNGYLPAVLCASYSPILLGLCVSFHWALQGLSTTIISNTFSYYQVIIPNAVFLIAIGSVLIFFIRPLCVYVVSQEQEDIGPILRADKGALLHQVYRHLKANWRKHLTSSATPGADKPPLVIYGLASAFSATLIAVVATVVLALMLLGGDGLAGAFLLMVMSIASILHCLASIKTGDYKDYCVLRVSWNWTVLWSLLMSVEFYATGHQQTFPAIQWEAAMLGTNGSFESQIIPAAKVVLNTFSSQMLMGFCIPLLLLWPITSRFVFGLHNNLPSVASDTLKQGEFFLFNNDSFLPGLFDLLCKFLTVLSSRLICSMIAAAILRRHLMVWKIFAPRFLFEASAFVISIPAILFGYILMVSVHAALSSWLKKLDINVCAS